jgi:hypothetical protein
VPLTDYCSSEFIYIPLSRPLIMWCKHIYSYFLPLIFILASYGPSNAYFCIAIPELFSEVTALQIVVFSHHSVSSLSLCYIWGRSAIHCSCWPPSVSKFLFFYHTIPLLASSVYNFVPKNLLAVFAHSNTEVVGSNPTGGIESVCIYSVCFPVCR